MNKDDYAINLLADKNCSNCEKQLFCSKKEKEDFSTCEDWEKEYRWGPADMMKILRQAYPNTIKSDIVEMQPMYSNLKPLNDEEKIKNIEAFNKILEIVKDQGDYLEQSTKSTKTRKRISKKNKKNNP